MRRKANRYRVDRVKRRKKILSGTRTAIAAFMVLISLALFSAALSRAYHALLDAPWLRVQEIEISGLQHMSRVEVLNAMGVARGASVFGLKLVQLKKRLEMLPWIRSALVRLDTPERLVVELVERDPVAKIAAGDHCLLMDQEGSLFAPCKCEEHPNLLLISGAADSGLKVGSTLQREVGEAVAGLLAAVRDWEEGLHRGKISQCHWNPDTGFLINVGEQGIPVQLGADNLEEKLRRLHEILGLLAERQWVGNVTRIDLDYGQRAYVEGQFPSFKGI